MTQPPMDPLAALMYQIAQAEPNPWYPKVFAEARGVPRDSLDGPLERLRLLGLVELTEWVANQGQGYLLTSAGKKVLYNPRLLDQLRTGILPTAAAPGAAPPHVQEWDDHLGPTPLQRGEAIRAGLLSKDRPVVTYALLAINIAFFLFSVGLGYLQRGRTEDVISVLMGNNAGVLLKSGALWSEDILVGKWWQLLTSCFVHIGFVHLAVNMYSLWVLGPLSEKAWGRWRYLALYLISGLGGSSAMAVGFLLDRKGGFGAGASGAIWGLMFAFGAWVYMNRAALGPALTSSWLRSIGVCVLINVFITFSVSFISKTGHFGGGGFGLAAALLLQQQRFGSRFYRRLGLLGVAVLPLVAVGSVVWAVQKVPGDRTPHNPQFMDLNSLLEHTVDTVNEVERQFHKGAVPLLDKEPDARDPKDIASVRDLLGSLRANLARQGAEMERFGPVKVPPLEKERETLLKYVRAQELLLEMASRKLEKGPDWRAVDEKAFKQQADDLEEIGRQWGELQK